MQNREIEVKSEALKLQELQLKLAAEQRDDYNSRCEISQHKLKIRKILLQACEVEFDFAQLLHYPYNPDQPGSISFKVPRKCSLFGVCNEATNRQATYLRDEAVYCGKSANTVISYVHHYLEKFYGECYLDHQADNCSGQNKNNTFIFYLCWHILKGLN